MDNNLSKQDWIDIHRASHWHNDFRILEISKFLEKPVEQILTTTKEYEGIYYKNVVAYTLGNFIQLKEYSIVRQTNLRSSDISFLSKEDIELSPNKYTRCIVDGTLFLTCKNYKLVLELIDDYRYERKWSINMMYRQTDEKFALDFLNELHSYAVENSYLKKAKISPDLSHIIINENYTWDSIILPENIKNEIQLNVNNLIRDLEIYKKNSIKFKRGLIFKGLPGTGKTLLAKIICNSVDCTFLWVTPGHLISSRTVRHICDMARELSPTILFLEDIDLYGEDRNSNSNASLLGELMNQLDGLIENHYVIVIATTNKVENIEEALKNRPGRFDRILEIPLPAMEGRLKMLELYCKNYKLDKVNLPEIACKTDKYTGAHIKELVNTAVIMAIDGQSFNGDQNIVLTMDHFVKNIEKVRSKKIEPAIGFRPQTPVGFPIEEDL